jgi:(5-formylfuran-3-yl)methyl phosphate synthase
MTKLLVSVRSAPEAALALSAGVDLIDIKDPTKGSLGAPDANVVEHIVREVDGRVPLSVALGELRDQGSMERLGTFTGVHYAKIGLAHCDSWPDWADRWATVLGRLPAKVQPVAVVYAEGTSVGAPDSDRVLAAAERLCCGAVLVDTFDKSKGTLLDLWPQERLKAFIVAVQRRGMLAVVGGSLSLEAIPSVAAFGPDYVALRGAVCRGGRTGPLDAELVQQVLRQVAASSPPSSIS